MVSLYITVMRYLSSKKERLSPPNVLWTTRPQIAGPLVSGIRRRGSVCSKGSFSRRQQRSTKINNSGRGKKVLRQQRSTKTNRNQHNSTESAKVSKSQQNQS